MPNTRRRRFAVQRDIAEGSQTKPQIGTEVSKVHTTSIASSSPSDTDNNMKSSLSSNAPKLMKLKKKSINSQIKIVAPLESVSEVDNASISSKQSASSANKNVGASSSNIELCKMLHLVNNEVEVDEYLIREHMAMKKEKEQKEQKEQKDQKPSESRKDDKYRQDKHRPHRVKVRSPRRRVTIPDPVKSDDEKVTQGTHAIDWDQEEEVYINHVNVMNIAETAAELPAELPAERRSTHSVDDMCRICHSGEALSLDLGQLVSACQCRGTVGRVHVKCLERWLTESGKSRCELCGTRYVTLRVHRYGVARALVMWILSQNAKQLMVDGLGIMLMSPLAVLAAWLSGRTLTGLMTQDSHVTPWPLASTFVLACMTLVCYYCWIVSAATRHALGWWIWYRSQYEVRLQILENEDSSNST